MSDIFPAVTRFIGDDMSLSGEMGIASIGGLVVSTFDIQFETWQVGANPEALTIGLNVAANQSDINARVLNRVDGVVVSA